MGQAMTSAEDKAIEAPVKPKRTLPRRGKWSAAVAEAARRETAVSAGQTTQTKPRPRARPANPANALWAKAQAAARSARLLSDAGDWDGAANRAYYAVFSAARAVLASVRASLADSKGHGTIVRRFEKHLVQERGLDPAFGRLFIGRLSHARWVADYNEVRVEETAARATLREMERFVAAVEPFLKRAKP
jgi:uncharacterized protein (UPF0332 family)